MKPTIKRRYTPAKIKKGEQSSTLHPLSSFIERSCDSLLHANISLQNLEKQIHTLKRELLMIENEYRNVSHAILSGKEEESQTA